MNMSPLGPLEQDMLGKTRQPVLLNGEAPDWFGVSATRSPSLQSVDVGTADPPQMCWRSNQCPISWVAVRPRSAPAVRSEEHTSELQSLMRISYAVFCLKKKKH